MWSQTLRCVIKRRVFSGIKFLFAASPCLLREYITKTNTVRCYTNQDPYFIFQYNYISKNLNSTQRIIQRGVKFFELKSRIIFIIINCKSVLYCFIPPATESLGPRCNRVISSRAGHTSTYPRQHVISKGLGLME